MSRLFRASVEFFDAWLADLFQSECLGCGKWSTPAACDDCLRFPVLSPIPGSSHRWLLPLRDPWRRFLHAVKYGGHLELLSVFRRLIVESELVLPSRRFVIIPVPVHFSTLRDRGFNQAEWLARWLAKAHWLPLEADGLRKTRATAAQSTLTEAQRTRNLVGSFRWSFRKAPPRVLLVDDVRTTGNTLQACARALRHAGSDEVRTWSLFQA